MIWACHLLFFASISCSENGWVAGKLDGRDFQAHLSSKRIDSKRPRNSTPTHAREKPQHVSLMNPHQCWPEGQGQVLQLLKFILRLSTPASAESQPSAPLQRTCSPFQNAPPWVSQSESHRQSSCEGEMNQSREQGGKTETVPATAPLPPCSLFPQGVPQMEKQS